MKRMGLLTLSLISLEVFGGTTICIDPLEKRLSYSFTAPDGGPPAPTVEKLVLDNKVLIDTPSASSAHVEEAKLELKGREGSYSMRTENQLLAIQTYHAQAVVKRTEDLTVLFDNVVLCRTSRYVGPPLPLPRPRN